MKNISEKKINSSNCYEDDNMLLTTYNEHIWLYGRITAQLAMKINKNIHILAEHYSQQSVGLNSFYQTTPSPPIWIHINSNGGSLNACFSIIDTIKNYSIFIPIITIVEGMAASAAALIAMSGSERFITNNSHMLLHQLSSGVEGTYQNLEDEYINETEYMNRIKLFIKNNSKIKKVKIMNDLLSHDYTLNSDKCLELGLVDKIFIKK